MGFEIAFENFVSALQAAQKRIQSTSNNVANAGTEGYTRTEVYTENRVLGDVGAGVKTTTPKRIIDDQLVLASFRQLSITSETSEINSVLKDIAVLFGTPGKDDNLSAKFDKFFTAIDGYRRNPGDEGIRFNLVESVKNFADNISTLATQLEDKRFEVDKKIGQKFDELNSLLADGKALNDDIGAADFKGLNKAALLDKRDTLIKKISDLIEVQVFYEDTGQFSVQATRATLIDKNFTYKIDYTPAFSSDTFIKELPLDSVEVFALKDGGNQQIKAFNTIVEKGVSGTVQPSFEGGRISGLFKLRDKIIPDVLAELDSLAEQLTEQFNKISNNGTGYPPANSLTGVNSLLSTSTLNATGKTIIAVVDNTGAPVRDRYGDAQIPLTLDLGKLNKGVGEGVIDVPTIVNEINEYYSGELQKVRVGNLDNIKIASLTDTLTTTAGPTPIASGQVEFDLEARNLSGKDSRLDVLGVNITDGVGTFQILPATLATTFQAFTFKPGERTRTDDVNSAHTFILDFNNAGLQAAFPAGVPGVEAGTILDIQVQVQVTDDTGQHTETITYQLQIPAGASTTQTGFRNQRLDVASISGTENGVIKTPIDNTFPLVASFVDENGNLQTDPTKNGVLKLQSGRDNYGVAISEQNSQITGTYEDGTLKKRTRGFSHFFGLNDVFETSSVKKNSALELKLQDRIKESPGLFPTSVLTRSIQSNVPNALPVWTYDVGEGNTDNAKAFSALKFIAFAFAQSGSAAQYNSTLGQYSADIISRFSTTSNNYIDANASEDTLLKSIDERRSSIESVNIDDELAKLLLYQNLYSTASRGISIVNSMFGELINILKQ